VFLKMQCYKRRLEAVPDIVKGLTIKIVDLTNDYKREGFIETLKV